jgi:long-chain acyl-CoA synthetase
MAQKRPVLYPVATKKAPYSLQVPGVEPKEGEGIPRRHPGSIDRLVSTPDPDVRTVYDIVVRGAKKFGTSECMGRREMIKTHVEKKMIKKVVDGVETEVPKEWIYYEKGGYTFKNFIEYKETVDTCGAGLRALGLNKNDRVHIYAGTRYGIPAAGMTGETDTNICDTLQCRMVDHVPWLRFSVHAHCHRL